jgi:hypothetical protein
MLLEPLTVRSAPETSAITSSSSVAQVNILLTRRIESLM